MALSCVLSWCALQSAGVLAVGSDVAQGDTAIYQTNRPTPVSAYGEVLAWSTFSDGAYRLMLDVGGTIAPAPTPPEPQAFDASVGPDQNNQVVVLFSRCRHYRSDPSQLLFNDSSSGCRIYTYSVKRHTIRALALGRGSSSSLTHPSQWRSNVVVVRSTTTGRFSIELISLSSHRRSRLAGATFAAARVDSMQLVGSRVSAGWYAGAGLETEIMLDTLNGKSPGEVLQESTRRSHSSLGSPEGSERSLFGAALAGNDVYWAAAGDQLIGTPSVLTFYNFNTHTSYNEEAPPDLFSATLSAGHLYYSTGTENGGCPCEIFKR